MTRVQADIIPSIKDWLDSRIAEADVRLNLPAKWTPTAGPVLVVADDGGPVLYPIKSDHTIRLTAWAGGRTQARRIVALAAGKLCAIRPRPTGVASVDSEMGGVIDDRDEATGSFFASVLVTVVARTVEAS